MRKMKCEICDGNNILKQSGVFVCQDCGTRYSVEEAKKLMNDTISVTSDKDTSTNKPNQIEIYMTMAKNAYSSNNLSEAEEYSNKIITIDAKNPDAWFLKGQAAGRQSTVVNERITEAVNCFTKSYEYASDDSKKTKKTTKSMIRKKAQEEIEQMVEGIISLAGSFFADLPHDNNAAMLTNILTICVTNKIECAKSTERNFVYNRETFPIAKQLHLISVAAYAKCLQEYKRWRTYPDNSDFTTYLDNSQNVLNVIGLISDLLNTEDMFYFYDSETKDVITEYPMIFEEMIEIETTRMKIFQDRIESAGYDSEYIDYKRDVPGGYERTIALIKSHGYYPDPKDDRYWFKSRTLSSEAKSATQKVIDLGKQVIAHYKEVIQEYEKVQTEKKNKLYWEQHKNEKLNLESELTNLSKEESQLESEVEELTQQIASLKKLQDAKTKSEIEIVDVKAQLDRAKHEIDSLGIFKGKQKAELKEKISSLEEKISELTSKASSERSNLENECHQKIKALENKTYPKNERLSEIKKRKNEINERLSNPVNCN